MVKKVIDIIPPEGWSGNSLPAGVNGADIRELPAETQAEIPAAIAPRTAPRMVNVPQTAASRFGGIHKNKGNLLRSLAGKAAIAAVLLLAVMYGVDVKFAKAVVKIWPATSEARQDVKVAVDTAIGDVDAGKNAIPGFVITAEKKITGDSPVTGKKSEQGKAQGTVKLFNNYTSAQRLVKNTRLQAPLEKFQPELAGDETPWFRTVEEIVLNPKSSATVKVVADGTGGKYNIEPSVFSVPGLVGTPQYTFVYGQSFEKFTGGSVDSAPEVKKEDLETAKIAIENQAKEQILIELETKAREQGLEIVDASAVKYEFGAPEITAKAGDSIAKIGAGINAKAAVIAFKRSDLESLGRRFVLSRISGGTIADEGSFAFESAYDGIEPSAGRPSLALTARVKTYMGMGQEELKKGLSEKKAHEAQLFLMSQPGTKDAKIQLAPPWRTAIPRDLDKIEVQVILD